VQPLIELRFSPTSPKHQDNNVVQTTIETMSTMASKLPNDGRQSHTTPSPMPFVASVVAEAVDLIDRPTK
jgi:hypothetical protein